jgi:hypothetical protein
MTTTGANLQDSLFSELNIGEYGQLALRVVVVPKKDKKSIERRGEEPALPLDVDPDEFLPEEGAKPLGSYLETGKGGKQCCVFLVNGQRQDALDNSFIIQQLGFKYLRSRMMIIVDVDGLKPEALGRLMQGSRQGFYRGDVWDAVIRRIVAILKGDPDLVRIEEDAEEQVSELEAGDEKVKRTLDKLIDSHHQHGLHFAEGAGAQGGETSDENLGIKAVSKDGVVSLLPPKEGCPAEYPVIVSRPDRTLVRLWPDRERGISISSMPSNAWPALAELSVEDDPAVPELRLTQKRMADHVELGLLFRQPESFDPDQYPVRARIRATAHFNGIKEPRRLELNVLVKPDRPVVDPVLNDPPTWLRVSSREPIKIKLDRGDTHVRLRWDGKDDLASGRSHTWTFAARALNSGAGQPRMSFSEPNGGRLTLLITPRKEWALGDSLRFEVMATAPGHDTLTATFDAIVVEPEAPPAEREPRLVDAEVLKGSSRRPPYVPRYISRDNYEEVECWGGADWTDEDPGCFKEPTDRAPLVLIINKDFAPLREYKRHLTKNYTEGEVERRITKYTSHLFFHLYQMYQAASSSSPDDGEAADQRYRTEIQRVATTLIRVMEVSR